jgi:drug/metabolite transporter (DMT)-like permease
LASGLVTASAAGLGGMLGFGSSEFATKKSVDKIGSVASLVWAHVLGTIALAVIVVVSVLGFGHPFEMPSGLEAWAGLVFFGCLQTAVYYFAYRAFEVGQVAVLAPIFASFAGLVALISVVALSERVKPTLSPALVAIFAGVILLNLEVGELKRGGVRLIGAPGVRDIAIATALATGWTLGWNHLVSGHDGASYSLIMFVFMTVSAYIVSRFQGVKLGGVGRSVWPFLWLIGIGEAVAYFAISLGYADTTQTAIVALLSGASALPTIILARIFLGERVGRIQTVGSLVVIAGVALLSLA